MILTHTTLMLCVWYLLCFHYTAFLILCNMFTLLYFFENQIHKYFGSFLLPSYTQTILISLSFLSIYKSFLLKIILILRNERRYCHRCLKLKFHIDSFCQDKCLTLSFSVLLGHDMLSSKLPELHDRFLPVRPSFRSFRL